MNGIYIESSLSGKSRGELIEIIENQHKKIKELERLSASDALTGLLHKKAAIGAAQKFLDGEGKNGFHAVIIADIDDFKSVNDSRGHLFGDRVITNFAASLKKSFGEDRCIIGRAGGDEFFILMKNCMLKDVLYCAEKLCSNFGRVCAGQSCSFVSCSLGVSCYPSDSRDLNMLYEYADIALYRSKSNGKNQCSVYDRSFGNRRL